MMKNIRAVREPIDDYCVVDIETTGLHPKNDVIIEIGALKIRNGSVVDTYEQLIKPHRELDEFAKQYNGIVEEMLADKPFIGDVKDSFLDFIGDDVVVGHCNASFDIPFLNRAFGNDFSNKYLDTYAFCRKLFAERKSWMTKEMCDLFDIGSLNHRALQDCYAKMKIFEAIKTEIADKKINLKKLFAKKHQHQQKKLKKNIVCTVDEIDEDNFFFGKTVVITGALTIGNRDEAKQILINLGAKVTGRVSGATDIVVIGDFSNGVSSSDGKTAKQRDAEKERLKGRNIQILDNETFTELLNDCMANDAE